MGAPKGNKYALGNKGGRPNTIPLSALTPLGETMKKWFEESSGDFLKKKGLYFPSFSRFARIVANCTHQTLLNYCKQDKEFFEAWAECKEIQRDTLIAAGMSGMSNPTFSIFVAKNLTDMKDKTETDITSGGKPLPIYGGKSVHTNDSAG